MPDFDLNFLRIVVTVLSFVTFLGIVAWALAKRNQAGFDEAAALPFAGERAVSTAVAGSVSSPAAESRNE